MNTLSQPLLKFRGKTDLNYTHSILCYGKILVFYTESVGETEETVAVFLTTTTAPESALTVVARGGKHDVVVEGSFEPGIAVW